MKLYIKTCRFLVEQTFLLVKQPVFPKDILLASDFSQGTLISFTLIASRCSSNILCLISDIRKEKKT
ncbi:hypothetical protein KUTeg_018895 [Tegillarca granosa]|uniref:Uncharacterized protein n=1 Tax=Tegillarca granosa TaxID=220873 RepID=A0ABQ9EAX8_TEGGR|nr:hypothetical protein KUTeg_018895 [Tegillarca granosa]